MLNDIIIKRKCKINPIKQILYIVTLCVNVSANNVDLYSIKNNRVTFHFESADSLYIKSLFAPVSDEVKNLSLFYGIQPANDINIFFPKTDKMFTRFTGGRLPEWSGAVAFTDKKIIVVKPLFYKNKQQTIITIVHELSHVYLAEISDQSKIPLWMNEGLAAYLSKKSINWNDGLILANAIAANNILSLSRIDSLLELNTASANLAYIEAQTAVEYLIQQVGKQKFRDLLTGLSDNSDINNLFLEIMGNDLEDFEYYWYRNLEDKYKWLIVLNFDNFFWILLVIIVIIAFVIVKIRNVKKIKKWEKAENGDFEDY